MKTCSTGLAPHWSRIVHRLHGLGELETSFINSIACLKESGHYPRCIPKSSEQTSQSLDGSMVWNFKAWDHGLVRQHSARSSEHAFICFYSKKKQAFHRLKVPRSDTNDCLSCLLKLFGTEDAPYPVQQPILAKGSHQYATILWNIAEKFIHPNYRRLGTEVQLITHGGFISKKLHFTQLEYQNQRIRLRDYQNRKLDIAPEAISDVQTQRKGQSTIITLYNQHHLPLLNFKLCA